MAILAGTIWFSIIPLVLKNMIDITLPRLRKSSIYRGRRWSMLHTELFRLLSGSKKGNHVSSHDTILFRNPSPSSAYPLVWSWPICSLNLFCSGWSKRGTHLAPTRFNSSLPVRPSITYDSEQRIFFRYLCHKTPGTSIISEDFLLSLNRCHHLWIQNFTRAASP